MIDQLITVFRKISCSVVTVKEIRLAVFLNSIYTNYFFTVIIYKLNFKMFGKENVCLLIEKFLVIFLPEDQKAFSVTHDFRPLF